MVKYLNALLPEEDEQSQLALAEGFVESVYGDMNDIKHSFFRIGFRLAEASEQGYCKALGYANITDLSFDKFGFSKSSTYELMAIYELAHKENAPFQMDERYDKFSQSQLRELCRLKIDLPGFMCKVKPSDTVVNIGKAVTFWNKYVTKHSGGPDVDNITDLLKLDINTPLDNVKRYISAKENPAYAEKSSASVKQLPGQIELNLNDETSADTQNSAYAENFEVQTPGKVDEEVREMASGQEGPPPPEWQIQKSAELDESLRASTSEVVECEVLEPPQAQHLTKEQLIEQELLFRPSDVRRYKIYAEFLKDSYQGFVDFLIVEYGDEHYQVDNKILKEKVIVTVWYNYLTIKYQNAKINQVLNVVLSWTEVATQIATYITTGKYLTERQKTDYLRWKAEQEGLKVNVVDARAKSEPVPQPPAPLEEQKEAGKLNFKNDKDRKAWLDAFREWGVWVDVPEVRKTFYRFNFANGCAVIVEVGIEYGDGYTLLKGEHELKRYSIVDKTHPTFDSHGISYTAVIQWLSAHGKEV
ncbi:MAG: hypothetical protein HDQ88_10625 [Clostridia bacterium]|nr:hypothetical protein [Clostridia bacterium]